MTAVIVCTSVSHGNTRRVAEVIGEVLGARVVGPADIDAAELSAHDLVGFGSGVFTMDLHRELREFVRSLPGGQRRRAFVFTTSGFPEPPFRRYRRRFVGLLERKGFDVVGTFSCFGFDTYLPLRIVGGVRKGRPNAEDLAAARRFAEGLAVTDAGTGRPARDRR